MKIWEVLEKVINPRHFLVVITFVLMALVFDPFAIGDRFQLTEFVQKHRPWIVFGLAISSGLLLIDCCYSVFGWTSNSYSRIMRRRSVKKIHLSKEAEVILSFVENLSPDPVKLIANNFYVRELRKEKLVYDTGSFLYGGQNSYKISSLGKERLKFSNTQFFLKLTEGDQLDFLRSVTGEDIYYRPVKRL